MSLRVGPHPWEPMGRWGKRKTKCRRCYLSQKWHPVDGWAAARPHVHRRWWW